MPDTARISTTRWRWPYHLSEPSRGQLARIADEAADQPYTYPDVGATRGTPPVGWSVDRRTTVLGTGAATFERAVEAARAWRMFDIPWVALAADGPPRPGQALAFASKQVGVWSINVCRVVWVDRTEAPGLSRFAFAYGTLPRHPLRGEEGFRIAHDHASDEVRFTVHQFSLPGDPVAKALWPVVRSIQRRFVEDAITALARSLS